VLTAVHWFICC